MSIEEQDDRLFKALADRTRRALLDALSAGPLTTGALCERFADRDRCTIMQHLTVLERAGLVLVKRAGRVRWNYLHAGPLQEMHERWVGRYAAPHARNLLALRRRLEEEGLDVASSFPKKDG